MNRTGKNDEAAVREAAWLGDAVLALFARQWLLDRADIPAESRSEAFEQLTGNQFLSALGRPTEVEARIGRLYREEGLDAAFTFMEAELIPVFLRQRNNRRRAGKRG